MTIIAAARRLFRDVAVVKLDCSRENSGEWYADDTKIATSDTLHHEYLVNFSILIK